MSFVETDEQKALRSSVAGLGGRFGHEYFLDCARSGRKTDELWSEAGKLGFIGVNLPEEYGGGGAGMYELSIVMEELAAIGSGLLMMVVSPAICGNVIARFGTDDQKKQWLPGLASRRRDQHSGRGSRVGGAPRSAYQPRHAGENAAPERVR